VQVDDGRVFPQGPLRFLNIGVKMVGPSFATLFSDASGQVPGDTAPVLGSTLVHFLNQDAVLFLRPRALVEVAHLHQVQPPSVALDLRLAGDKLANSVP